MKRSSYIVLFVLCFVLNSCATQKANYLAFVYNKDTKKFQYINQKGEISMDKKFLYSYNFSENYALVYLEDTTWALINPSGDIVYRFADSINELMKPDLSFGELYYNEINVNIQLRDSILVLVNTTFNPKSYRFFYHIRKGTLYKGRNFVSAGNFSEGKALVNEKKESDKYINGYIDLSGNYVLKLKQSCSIISEFHNGKTLIICGDFFCEEIHYVIIDTSGTIIDTLLSYSFNESKHLLNKYNINSMDGSCFYDECYGFDNGKYFIKYYNRVDFTKNYPKNYLYQCTFPYKNYRYPVGFCTKKGKVKFMLPKNYRLGGDFKKINKRYYP